MAKRQPICDAPLTIYLVGQQECNLSALAEHLSQKAYQLVDLCKIDQPLLSLVKGLPSYDHHSAAWDKINTINRSLFDIIASDAEKNYLLVNTLIGNQHDEVIFHQVKKMAATRASLFLPVLLLSEATVGFPLAKELKESRYYLTLDSKIAPEQITSLIIDYVATMVADFKAQPDLICDEIIIDESENPPARAIIKNGVMEFNKRFLGEWKPSPFSLYIRNAEGIIIAGVCGDYIHAYTRVNWAWVHEDFRGRGVGKRALSAVEEFAKGKGCRYMQLDTMDFQARPFYQSLGFWVVATLPNWINGHECYIMRKDLLKEE